MKYVGEMVTSLIAQPADLMPLTKAIALLNEVCRPQCAVRVVAKLAVKRGIQMRTLRRACKALGVITSYASRAGAVWVKAATLGDANNLVLRRKS